jgi:hypothetical protein
MMEGEETKNGQDTEQEDLQHDETLWLGGWCCTVSFHMLDPERDVLA